jgi:hypothetical protein
VPLPPDVEEALRRAAVVWVGLDGRPPRAVWHVWQDGAALVVAGGGEQELPGAAEASRARLVLRRRSGLAGRLATLEATARRLWPGEAEWDAAVAALAPQRLNAPDVERLPQRWARASVVLRLEPDGG